MIWMWIGVTVAVLVAVVWAVLKSRRKRQRLAAARDDAFAIRPARGSSLDNPRYAGLPPWPDPPPARPPVPRAAPPARPARRERRDSPVPHGPASAPVDTPSTIPVFVSDSPPAEPSFTGGGGDFGGGGASYSGDTGTGGGDTGGSDP